MTWTSFSDSHSGGGRKMVVEHIWIEAPEPEARSIFFSRFGINPSRVSCTCCGSDYSVFEEDESNDLAVVTSCSRGCDYDRETGETIERQGDMPIAYPYTTLQDYVASEDVAVIYADDILDVERFAVVPEQGYVWR